jgi:hypothetical protein
MGLDDRASDRKPHPQPLGLGKQAFELRLIEPGAGLPHFGENAGRVAAASEYR